MSHSLAVASSGGALPPSTHTQKKKGGKSKFPFLLLNEKNEGEVFNISGKSLKKSESSYKAYLHHPLEHKETSDIVFAVVWAETQKKI